MIFKHLFLNPLTGDPRDVTVQLRSRFLTYYSLQRFSCMFTRNCFRYVFCIFLSVYFLGCDNPSQLLDEKAKEVENLKSQVAILNQRNLDFKSKVRELKERERAFEKYRKDREENAKKLNTRYALALEGGGTRGIIAAAFLDRFDAEVLNSQPSDKDTTPEFFDFISGTSIGGINALFLASDPSTIPGSMNVPDTSGASLLKVYAQENIESIFTSIRYLFPNLYGTYGPMYGGKAGFLQRLYGKDTTFDSLAKPVLILTYDYAKSKPYYFSSYDKKDDSVKVWQIADGTSAAPTFFPMSVIDIYDESGTPDKMYTMDGSFLSNNPCVNAYVEMRKQFPYDNIKILSLSSGSLVPKMTAEQAKGWINSSGTAWVASSAGKLIERFLVAPALNAVTNCKRLLKDNFMHIPFYNAPITAIDETDEDKLMELKTAAREEFTRVKDELRVFFDTPSAAAPDSL